ncbi:TPA: hypothetical protein ACH7AQ_004935, partial [Escherichia coli]
FCHADPVSGGYGSSFHTPAHCGQETLHMPLIQLNYLLYVVLIPLSLTRRAGPEKTASLIPCAWYTSGKS